MTYSVTQLMYQLKQDHCWMCRRKADGVVTAGIPASVLFLKQYEIYQGHLHLKILFFV